MEVGELVWYRHKIMWNHFINFLQESMRDGEILRLLLYVCHMFLVGYLLQLRIPP